MHTTREGWLKASIELLRPWFTEQQHEIPELYVSVSFPATGGRSGQRIGECHHSSRDGSPHVLVHPYLEDPIRVLDVVVHELVHVVMGPDVGHKAPFRHLALEIGLTGESMKATVATPELREVLASMVRRSLGPYPHSALQQYVPKQQSRQMKVVCVSADCPAFNPKKKDGRHVVRMSATRFEEWGNICGACAEPMVMEVQA
ncbi:hypothetical protein [Spirillospora sp. CA-294931]|uniref:hypothetical protein n=1 Tax=Spirillospora sp. CA-294931 TaxID=3240042 RepID=UPI003D8B5104